LLNFIPVRFPGVLLFGQVRLPLLTDCVMIVLIHAKTLMISTPENLRLRAFVESLGPFTMFVLNQLEITLNLSTRHTSSSSAASALARLVCITNFQHRMLQKLSEPLNFYY
jgi:hypothetical protein